MSDVALILAAGSSRRLGQPKQLVRVDDEPLVARAVRVAREAGLEPVVVTGCAADAVAAVVDAELVHNDRWREGMGTSIVAGVEAVREHATSITIMTCDQHAVTPADLSSLRDALGDADICAAEYDGVCGVPATFTPACYEALSRLRGDVGAQNLIRSEQFRVARVSLICARHDVDEPTDLEELR